MGRSWRGILAITGVAWLPLNAHAQTPGFWLVGIPAGGNSSTVQSLSLDGSMACGGSFIPAPNKAGSFRWTVGGGRDDWGYLPGMPQRNYVYACDDSGQIVAGGMSAGTLASERAFRRVGDGPLEDLGLLAGEERSYASGISGDGQIVVGYCEHGPFIYKNVQAFRWTPSGGMEPLGKLTPFSPLCDARAISRDGTTIVGLNQNEVGWYQAFVWREAEGMRALPTLTGGPVYSEAKAVNADGSVIVGTSTDAGGVSRFVRWKNGVVENIAPAVGPSSAGYSVNDDGDVAAGVMLGKPVVWTPGTGSIFFTEQLVKYGFSVPPGYQLEYIYAISGDGLTFGGMARNLATNKKEGWVAMIPGANTCVPDCDASGQLDIDDFICFQTHFALGDTKADCDGSGSLNIDDLICFQTYFAIGC